MRDQHKLADDRLKKILVIIWKIENQSSEQIITGYFSIFSCIHSVCNEVTIKGTSCTH